MRIAIHRALISVLLISALVSCYGDPGKPFDFKLTNYDGKQVSIRDLKGNIVLMTFAYAHSEPRQPVVTSRLLSLDETLKRPKDIVYMHISLDPDKDTAEARMEYLKRNGIDIQKDSRWVFVTGGKEELRRIWNMYRVRPTKVADKGVPDGYYIDYDQKIVVLDKDGAFKKIMDERDTDQETTKAIKEIIGG